MIELMVAVYTMAHALAVMFRVGANRCSDGNNQVVGDLQSQLTCHAHRLMATVLEAFPKAL